MTSNIVNKSIEIHTPPARVWKVLTAPDLIRQWISDEPLEIDIGDIQGGAVLARGEMHGHAFENKGTILAYVPFELLRYSYLSSLSRLPDRPQNYSIIEFILRPLPGGTMLTLKQDNFITFTNYKHFDFYWNVTLLMIKKLSEQEPASVP